MNLIKRIRKWFFLRQYKKNQEKKKKELLPRKEEIIHDTFAILDANLRKASIAQVGGFRPPDDPRASWLGKVLLAREGEQWPQWKPPFKLDPEPVLLTPLGQFNLMEIPFVPEKLKRFVLITVFIDEERLPYEQPNGKGWVVRAYESFEGLVRLEPPQTEFSIRPFPIRWSLAESEGPSWGDAWRITDLTEFNTIDDEGLFHDRYHNSERTKLGGYPALIQGELKFGIDDFVFQIGTEDKAKCYWGDGGAAYFGLSDEGQWMFEWSCY